MHGGRDEEKTPLQVVNLVCSSLCKEAQPVKRKLPEKPKTHGETPDRILWLKLPTADGHLPAAGYREAKDAPTLPASAKTTVNFQIKQCERQEKQHLVDHKV